MKIDLAETTNTAAAEKAIAAKLKLEPFAANVFGCVPRRNIRDPANKPTHVTNSFAATARDRATRVSPTYLKSPGGFMDP